MFAARAEMINQHLINASEDFILCDRYYHASIAYQGYGRKLSLKLIDRLIDDLNCRIPNITIIYDLDVNEGFKRKSGDVIDRIESAGAEFFSDVRNGYLQLANNRSEVYVIDASRSVDQVTHETKRLIKELL